MGEGTNPSFDGYVCKFQQHGHGWYGGSAGCEVRDATGSRWVTFVRPTGTGTTCRVYRITSHVLRTGAVGLYFTRTWYTVLIEVTEDVYWMSPGHPCTHRYTSVHLVQ